MLNFSRLHRVAPSKAPTDSAEEASFQSDEGQLPEWIRCIDVWIGNANRQQAEEVQQADSDRDRREDADRQRQEDIRRVNEKFKNL